MLLTDSKTTQRLAVPNWTFVPTTKAVETLNPILPPMAPRTTSSVPTSMDVTQQISVVRS